MAELVEERSAAKKLRRELEMKKKEMVEKQTSPVNMMKKMMCMRATSTRSRRMTTRGKKKLPASLTLLSPRNLT